jgi:hypothetical protein
MRTRTEHLAWCKQRALEYLDKGDVSNAVASMMSDLQKHDETALEAGSILSALGLSAAMSNNSAEARRFIEGFN